MDLAKEFLALFQGNPNHRGRYVITNYTPNDKGKITGRASTIPCQISEAVWKEHLEGRDPLGIVPTMPNGTTAWACYDIDIYPTPHTQLIERLARVGLQVVVCRSKSGGAHVYFFFSTPISCDAVIRKMREMTGLLGLERTVEIYPKQEDLGTERGAGNWVNMPYENGEKSVRVGLDGYGSPLSAEDFIAVAHRIRLRPEEFLGIDVQHKEILPGGPPCLNRIVLQGGLSEFRNNFFYSLGVYYRKVGLTLEEALAKAQGVNAETCTPELDAKELRDTITSAYGKEYFYKCTDLPIKNHCSKAACRRCKFGIGGGEETELAIEIIRIAHNQAGEGAWQLETSIGTVLVDEETLFSLPRLKVAFLKQCRILLPNVTTKAWHKLLDKSRDKIEVIDETSDLSNHEMMRSRLMDWLGSNLCTEKQDLLVVGRPIRENGRYIFRPEDFEEYLKARRWLDLDRSEVYAWFRKWGFVHARHAVNGTRVRVWYVPCDQVPAKALPSVPETTITENL